MPSVRAARYRAPRHPTADCRQADRPAVRRAPWRSRAPARHRPCRCAPASRAPRAAAAPPPMPKRHRPYAAIAARCAPRSGAAPVPAGDRRAPARRSARRQSTRTRAVAAGSGSPPPHPPQPASHPARGGLRRHAATSRSHADSADAAYAETPPTPHEASAARGAPVAAAKVKDRENTVPLRTAAARRALRATPGTLETSATAGRRRHPAGLRDIFRSYRSRARGPAVSPGCRLSCQSGDRPAALQSARRISLRPLGRQSAPRRLPGAGAPHRPSARLAPRTCRRRPAAPRERARARNQSRS